MKRFSFYMCGDIEDATETEYGEFVRFADHEARVKELEADNKRWERRYDILLTDFCNNTDALEAALRTIRTWSAVPSGDYPYDMKCITKKIDELLDRKREEDQG